MRDDASPLEGYPAMSAWGRSFKPHHLPRWASKAIRRAVREGRFGGDPPWNRHYGSIDPYHYLDCNLWDHWGTIIREDCLDRVLIAQPYYEAYEEAERFAKAIQCYWRASQPGPWHPKTILFEFWIPSTIS